MSFDPIDNGWRKYLKNGGIGHTQKKTLTNDGKLEGKENFNVEGSDFVRIGDAIDISTITIIYLNDNGIPIAECESQDIGNGCFSVSYVGTVGVYVLGDSNEFNVSSGTYVLCDDGFVITCIETETIHTIDPKYISGVTLPIVELEPVTGGGYPAPLSDANCAALNALGGMPFVAVVKEESEVIIALVCSFFEGFYLCNGGTLMVVIAPSDEQGEQWMMNVRDTADDS